MQLTLLSLPLNAHWTLKRHVLDQLVSVILTQAPNSDGHLITTMNLGHSMMHSDEWRSQLAMVLLSANSIILGTHGGYQDQQ